MTKQEFITAARAAADKSSARSGLPVGVTVAQSALESAWGASQLSQKANNYFGIKAQGSGKWIEMPTEEVVAGRAIKTSARFARYDSMEQAFIARDRIILTLGLYAEARGHTSEPIAFIHSLAKHWATDPVYGEKLENIYLTNGFNQLDSSTPQSSQPSEAPRRNSSQSPTEN